MQITEKDKKQIAVAASYLEDFLVKFMPLNSWEAALTDIRNSPTHWTTQMAAERLLENFKKEPLPC